jgi:hypothetical protein
MSGLANLNPLEGHTIRKDSPEGHPCVYMYRGWAVNSDAVIYKNDIFIAIEVFVLYSVAYCLMFVKLYS